jgi:hypothetical protein
MKNKISLNGKTEKKYTQSQFIFILHWNKRRKCDRSNAINYKLKL